MMGHKIKSGKEKIIFIYLLFICILCISYYFLEIPFHGKYFTSVFANDPNDTFMDFFHSINNAKFDPYAEKFSNYPAMACLIYKVFFAMIPYELRDGDGFNLRNIQAAMIPFIIYNAVIIWFIQTIVREKSLLEKKNKIIFSIILLFCAPIVFTVERGNLLLLSFALTMFFAFFFDSENNVLKEFAFIALAIAASIKIYPAIFGLLLLKKKRIKEIVRLIIYGVVIFIVPFFYYDGITSLKLMIEALVYTSNLSGEIGYGINLSLYNIIQTFGILFNINIKSIFIYILYIFVAGLLLFGSLVLKKKWQESLCVTLLMIFIPKTNYYYIMIFMIIPIVEFINECHIKQEKFETIDYIVSLIFAVILVPWPSNIISIFADDKFPVTYCMLCYYFALCCLVVVILYEVIKLLLKRKSKRSGI